MSEPVDNAGNQSSDPSDEFLPGGPSWLRELIRGWCRDLTWRQLAHLVWDRYLTDDERRGLGSFEEACVPENGGIVGIWSDVKNVDPPRAVLEIAHNLGLSPGDYDAALRALEEENPSVVRPVWDSESRELRYNGTVIRRVRSLSNSPNVVAILDEFQAEGWRRQIDDPLPQPADSVRLRDAVRSLNEGTSTLRFRTANGGRTVEWGLASERQ